MPLSFLQSSWHQITEDVPLSDPDEENPHEDYLMTDTEIQFLTDTFFKLEQIPPIRFLGTGINESRISLEKAVS
jgi:hypothetical protein